MHPKHVLGIVHTYLPEKDQHRDMMPLCIEVQCVVRLSQGTDR